MTSFYINIVLPIHFCFNQLKYTRNKIIPSQQPYLYKLFKARIPSSITSLSFLDIRYLRNFLHTSDSKFLFLQLYSLLVYNLKVPKLSHLTCIPIRTFVCCSLNPLALIRLCTLIIWRQKIFFWCGHAYLLLKVVHRCRWWRDVVWPPPSRVRVDVSGVQVGIHRPVHTQGRQVRGLEYSVVGLV